MSDTGTGSLFLVAWRQTQIDDRPAGPVAALCEGARWRWHGRPVECIARDQIDAPCLNRALSRLVPNGRYSEGVFSEDPVSRLRLAFVNARGLYTARLIEMTELARPVLAFPRALPPAGETLIVTALGDAAVDALLEGGTQPAPPGAFAAGFGAG